MGKSFALALRNVALFLLTKGIVAQNYSSYGNAYMRPMPAQNNYMYPQVEPSGPTYDSYQPTISGREPFYTSPPSEPTFYPEPYENNWDNYGIDTIYPTIIYNSSYNQIVNVYDPEIEICCLGNIYTNSYSRCCGDKAYDYTRQVCCSNVVYDLKPGFTCCGIEYFDVKEKLCCNSNSYGFNSISLALPIQVRGNGNLYKFYRCCGQNQLYDSRTQRCCQRLPNHIEVISKNDDKAICQPLDTFYALPSIGAAGAFNSVPSQQFCGPQMYDPNIQLCCGTYGNYSIVQKNKPNDHCCGTRSYTPGEQVCCIDRNSNRSAVHLAETSDSQCCGVNLYSISKEICCPYSGVIQAKISPTSQCCGNQSIVYDQRQQICCGDVVLDLPRESRDMRQASSCCLDSSGNVVGIYDWRSQRCCDGVIVSASQNELCCGKRKFNPSSDICCGGIVLERSTNQQCCVRKAVYDPSQQICCPSLGIVVNKKSPDDTVCCGSVGYNHMKQLCCGSNGTEKLYPRRSRKQYCCGDSVVNPDEQQMCCPVLHSMKRQLIVVRSTSPNDRCCGGAAVNPSQSICCNGTAIQRQGQTPMRCCGKSHFSPRTQICCEGNVFPRQENDMTKECCGPVLYDRRESKCCAGVVKPATSPYSECCFG